jgi:hypothetical protein
MTAAKDRNADAGKLAVPDIGLLHPSRDTCRVPRSHVARLWLAARCLGTPAVFVCDHPLVAELFDARGRHVDTWSW